MPWSKEDAAQNSEMDDFLRYEAGNTRYRGKFIAVEELIRIQENWEFHDSEVDTIEARNARYRPKSIHENWKYLQLFEKYPKLGVELKNICSIVGPFFSNQLAYEPHTTECCTGLFQASNRKDLK